MKTNRILIGLLAFVLVVVIATSGYMLGLCQRADQLNPRLSPAAIGNEAPVSAPAATQTPEKSASNGATDTSPAAPIDKSMPTFWEVYDLLKQNTMAMICRQGKQLEYDAIQGMIFGLDDQFTSFISPGGGQVHE